jgi:hypothetical protein
LKEDKERGMKALKFVFVVLFAVAFVLFNACGSGGGGPGVDKIYIKILAPNLQQSGFWMFQQPASPPKEFEIAEPAKYLRIVFDNYVLFGFVNSTVFPFVCNYDSTMTVRSAVLNVDDSGVPSLSDNPPVVLGFDIDYYHESFISTEGVNLGEVKLQAAYYTSKGDYDTKDTDVNYYDALSTNFLGGFSLYLPYELTQEKFLPGNWYNIKFDVNFSNWPGLFFTYDTGEGKPEFTNTATQVND